MRFPNIFTSLLLVCVCSFSYAQESPETTSAENYRLEALYAIKLIELMGEYRDSQDSDLANLIECSIDSSLWDSHTPLKDKNKFEKYTPEEIAGFKNAHVQLLEALRNYRSKYPEAKCVK